MEVKGNMYVFGDNIAKQVIGTQINGAEKAKKPAPKTLREKIDTVMGLLLNGSMWFCIYRGMVDAGLHTKGDYAGFVSVIQKLYPEGVPHGIDAGTISELDVQSWADPLEKWTRDNAPRTGKKYTAYEDLTDAFEAVLMLQ